MLPVFFFSILTSCTYNDNQQKNPSGANCLKKNHSGTNCLKKILPERTIWRKIIPGRTVWRKILSEHTLRERSQPCKRRGSAPDRRCGKDLQGTCRAGKILRERLARNMPCGKDHAGKTCKEQVAYFQFHVIMQNTENIIRTSNTVWFDLVSGRISAPSHFLFSADHT